MSWLLDVNFILASRWITHPDNAAVTAWLDAAPEFATCPISELGFVRISLTTAYGATWRDTQESLARLHARSGYRFLVDDVKGTDAPETGPKDTTDAHLVTLARHHGMKVATLDTGLLAKPWAVGIAENPAHSSKT